MAGLLGFLDNLEGSDPSDPKFMATLRMAQGLLGGGGNMQQLSRGMGAYSETMARARAEKEARRAREQEMQMRSMQMQAAIAAQDKARMQEAQAGKDAGLMQRLMGMPVEQQQAPGAMGPGAPMQNNGVDPRTFLAQGGSMGGLPQALALNQALASSPRKITASSPGQIGRYEDGTEAWRNPAAPEKVSQPSSVQEYQYAQEQGYRGTFEQWKAAQKPAGVSVSYGAPTAGVGPDGRPIFFQPSKDGGPPSIIQGVAPPAREMPATVRSQLAQNNVTLQKIDRALGLVDANPAAFGLQNSLPDGVIQRVDPGGVEARAAVADIAGQKIHDRSGAAVTVGETARLKPYVPNVTDTPSTVQKKLQAFRQEYAAVQRELASGGTLDQVTQTRSPSQRSPQQILMDADAIINGGQ